MPYRTIYRLTFTRWTADPAPIVRKYRRADAAHRAAIRLAYDAIKADARLDTKAGHMFMDRVLDWQVSPPKPGWSHHWEAMAPWADEVSLYGCGLRLDAFKTFEQEA